jgi:hypothetical protein
MAEHDTGDTSAAGPAARHETDARIDRATPAAGVQAAGERSVAIGGTASGSTIITGDSNVVTVTYPASAPPLADNLRDFDELLRQATAGFVGRHSVFAALEAFQREQPCGYFEILGDAGLGKTALAAAITTRFKAIAFFADAARGLRRPDQCLSHLCSALILDRALPYSSLPARASEDNAFLTRILSEAARARPGPVWIVVDALDEADAPPARENPLLLPPALPRGVYVVVTRQRDVPHLLRDAGTPMGTHRILRDDPEQDADIEAYLRGRLAGDVRISSALAQARPPIAVEEFVREVKEASEGNFRYLSYMLEDIITPTPGTALDLHALPRGLAGYYDRFWPKLDEVPAPEWPEWKSLYLPVIQRLGVAAEPVTEAWLAWQVGCDADEIRFRALPRWRRVLSSEQHDGEEAWRIVHQSFATFLAHRIGPAALARRTALWLRPTPNPRRATGRGGTSTACAMSPRTLPRRRAPARRRSDMGWRNGWRGW